MRQRRAKTYRKLMNLYSMSFGFRQPYQVLVDSEMCKISVGQTIELVKQLSVVLQGVVKPSKQYSTRLLVITQCCIHELYLQGKLVQPAVDLAKAFERRKCNHKEAIPGDDCISEVVGETNKHRYVVATQSSPLRGKLRGVPAVPIVHITRSVMILEPPSSTTLKAKEKLEETALHAPTPETGPTASSSEPSQRKHSRPKGPNPLSVKKKKVVPETVCAGGRGSKRKQEETTGDAEDGHKRRRKRRRKVGDAAGVSDDARAQPQGVSIVSST